jgi:hypothetical protein
LEALDGPSKRSGFCLAMAVNLGERLGADWRDSHRLHPCFTFSQPSKASQMAPSRKIGGPQ